MIITIDGPAGSGKSSAARIVAKELGYALLNTGMLYRAAAYVVLTRHNFEVQGEFPTFSDEAFERLTNPDEDDLAALEHLEYHVEGPSVTEATIDITSRLYEPWIDKPSAVISQNEDVRDIIVAMQRAVAQNHDVVAEGRDCGSVVFPDAEFQFFLTASLDIRAQRIASDAERGRGVDFATLKQRLAERDERDMNRSISPLQVSSNARVIDNSNLSMAQTVDRIVNVVKYGQE